MPEISPKAIVLNPGGLADDVRVGPFSFIGPEVTVGPGSEIANHVTVAGRTRIGPNCRLLPGCVVGCESAARPEGPAPGEAAGEGLCTIGEGSTVREHVLVEAGRGPGGTVIGPYNLLMVGTQVGHDAVTEDRAIFANFTCIEHHARVERFVQTVGFASVGAYATVGAYGYVTGYAVIDRDAPPYAISRGFPFRVRGVNVEKLRRCKFDEPTIDALKEAFRALFDGEQLFAPAAVLAAVEGRLGGPHVAYLIASLRRGAASPTGRHLEPAP